MKFSPFCSLLLALAMKPLVIYGNDLEGNNLRRAEGKATKSKWAW
jgi:hypothetical protein